MENVACDLCGATASNRMYVLNDPVYDAPGEFALGCCVSCGLIFLNPRPTQEKLAAHYPPEYMPYRPAVDDERFGLMRWMRKRKLAQRRRMLERYSTRRHGRILDVGCATGLFLHEMDTSGWEVEGVEPIVSAAEYARSRFGLTVHVGTLSEATSEPASFDVITFWDVLEHTESPAKELALAAGLLRPGGQLVASIPNWDSFDRRLFGRHWVGLDPPRHLYVFTKQTLDRLLRKAGFEVLEWICFFPGYFAFAISLERCIGAKSPRIARWTRRIMTIPGLRFPFEPWFYVLNRIGRGPVITVFAQKAALDHQRRECS